MTKLFSTLILLLLLTGCASTPSPTDAVKDVKIVEPPAIFALRDKASRLHLKFSVFDNGDEYLAYATDGSRSLSDCRDHWNAKGKTAEEAASNLSKAIDGPRNSLVHRDKFTEAIFGCTKRQGYNDLQVNQ